MFDLTARHILPAALSLLPAPMDSPAARALLLAIGLQESRFEYRLQKGGGPAHGYWQFERGGGVRGVLSHSATAGHARRVCAALHYEPRTGDVYRALADNDLLACCLARLLLWTLPGALPGPADAEEGWRQYTAAWRPGKPHPETWPAFHARAWAALET